MQRRHHLLVGLIQRAGGLRNRGRGFGLSDERIHPAGSSLIRAQSLPGKLSAFVEDVGRVHGRWRGRTSRETHPGSVMSHLPALSPILGEVTPIPEEP